MAMEIEIKLEFNDAARNVPESGFYDVLRQENIDRDTARKVIQAFQQMGLPAPDDAKESAHSEHGGRLIFMNDYGLVLRIEGTGWKRINDSPWVLPPIASFHAGGVIMEIIPAIDYTLDASDRDALHERLLQDGIRCGDDKLANVGRIPVRTLHFPNGIPVILDRPAAQRSGLNNDEVRQARSRMTEEDVKRYHEAVETEKNLYNPLRQVFSECWPDAQKMKRFWDMCRSYVQENKLVASWNDEASSNVYDEKASYAFNVAKNYTARLQLAEQPVSSAAPAVRQSPLQPV